MAKRIRQEQQFGSDSFLDVVCNVVGIIVILIVIAGIRISRAPATPFATRPSVAVELGAAGRLEEPLLAAPPSMLPEPDATEIALAPTEPAADPIDYSELDATREEIARLELELEESGAALDSEASTALQKQIQSEQSRLEELRRELARFQGAYSKFKLRHAERERALAELEQAVDIDRAAREAEQTASAARVAELERLQQKIAECTRQIQVIEDNAPPVQTLEHRVTPISRTVTGPERHYRISGGKIAEVPVDALIDRLRAQVERRKDWIAKMRQHQGEVGPVDGFKMFYVVQRDTLGVLDEVGSATGMLRITVSQWRVQPEPDLVSESVETATNAGGRFYQSILTAPADATLTFWVYPDSFAEYARFRRFAHEHGFVVAGRPLPPGAPIAGSPKGSRSAGQ